MPSRHWLDPFARRVLKVVGYNPRLAESSSKSKQTEWFVDVNRATANDWLKLPGCNEYMADLLIRLQNGGVQFTDADDIFRLLELPKNLSLLWRPHLLFNWYGDLPSQIKSPPLDLNNASAKELIKLGWKENRIYALIKERRKKSFKDLAELQERLCLPASSVEALIGRVCFGKRKEGPSLPPRS